MISSLGKTHVTTRSTIWCASHHESVPARRIVGFDILAPVRVGITVLEARRPVIAANLGEAEVVIETRHEVIELHSR